MNYFNKKRGIVCQLTKAKSKSFSIVVSNKTFKAFVTRFNNRGYKVTPVYVLPIHLPKTLTEHSLNFIHT